jgi:hypothetical protein
MPLRLRVVLRDAQAFLVHVTETELGVGVTLVRGLAKPLYRREILLRHVSAELVHRPEGQLGRGVALVGKRAQQLPSPSTLPPTRHRIGLLIPAAIGYGIKAQVDHFQASWRVD